LRASATSAVQKALVVISLVLLCVLLYQPCVVAGQIELSTFVEALDGGVSIDGNKLVVDERDPVDKWKVTYHITAVQADQVSRIFAVDSYGPGLAVESARATSGDVFISPAGKRGYGQSIEWSGFSLEPGGRASLTVVLGVVLGTSGSSVGQDRAPSRDYVLNAGMVVEFVTGQRAEAHESVGKGYSVEVRRRPQVLLTMSSPELEWYIRRPGVYYVKAFHGTVASNALVVISFSDFTHLKNVNTGAVIPVYYSLQTEHPGVHEWILPEELSAVFLEVLPYEEAVEWALWQRVILEEQSVGEYIGGGVITFTMQNVQDAFGGG